MNEDERDILLARYFDGSATAEQLELLDRAAANDPAIARAMLAVAAEELSLLDALAVGASRINELPFEAAPQAAFAPAHENALNGKHLHPSTAATVSKPANSLRIVPIETASQSASWFVRSRMWMSIAACVLIAAGAVYWMTRSTVPPAAPTIAERSAKPQPLARLTPQGPGVVVEHQGVAQGADGDIAVSSTDVIRTTGSPASFVYAQEQTQVTLAPMSRLSLAGDLANKRLELLSGSINCEVQKQQPGKPLIVSTPQARVQVVGTRFDVTSHGDWTRVEVSQGTVRVTRLADGSTVDVSAGEYVYCGKSPVVPNSPPAGFAAAPGRNLSAYWSTQIRPAGIEH